jgi:hypothetical protein
MGVENRDWDCDESRRGRGGPTPTWVWVVGAVVVLAVLALISPSARDRIGIRLPFELEETFGGKGRSGGFLVFPLAGAPPISLGGSLYASDDPWRAWLAPESACPRGEDRDAPAVVQTHVLLCLVN